MTSHVSHCMAKAYACRTHGKSCVWHMASHVSSCMASYVSSCMALLKPINMGVPIQFGGQQDSVCGSNKKKEEEGKREREERKRKGKKKREEERGGRKEKERGKRKRKRKECCAVSRPE